MALVLSMGVICAHAADSAKIYVTVADEKGELAAAAEELTVTDANNDGELTAYDAIYCAHEAFYEGGASEGFATEMTQYGLSIIKMWGVANGGSYGYTINNQLANGMDDPIKDDDYFAMYVFTEPKLLLDKYSYFDRFMEDVEAGEVTLTLTKLDFDYDNNWSVINVPVEGATITVDGEAIDAKTDADGKVTFTLDTNGEHIVSAKADDQVLVPPVYKANVTGGKDPATPDAATPATEATVAPEDTATEAVTEPATDSATDDSATKDSASKDSASKDSSSTSSATTPKTNDSTHLYLWLLITLVSFFGICTVVIYKKKHVEK